MKIDNLNWLVTMELAPTLFFVIFISYSDGRDKQKI